MVSDDDDMEVTPIKGKEKGHEILDLTIKGHDKDTDTDLVPRDRV
jgi:hypothetical protein